jgi:hypothetical protein
MTALYELKESLLALDAAPPAAPEEGREAAIERIMRDYMKAERQAVGSLSPTTPPVYDAVTAAYDAGTRSRPTPGAVEALKEVSINIDAFADDMTYETAYGIMKGLMVSGKVAAALASLSSEAAGEPTEAPTSNKPVWEGW